jgi:nucleotide-binding universal stress UspA family protein
MRILVATDGSAAAQAAVRLGVWLASRVSASRVEVVLVGAVGRAWGQGVPFSGDLLRMAEEEERSRARRAFAAAARIAAQSRVALRTRYIESRGMRTVASVISRHADDTRANLVVVGRSGRGGLARIALGSVASRLVLIARRPVLIVPHGFRQKGRSPLRVLVGADGSPAAAAALRFAASLVKRAPRARLTVVVVGTLWRNAVLTPMILPFIEQLEKSERRWAREILRRAALHTRSMGVPAEFRYHYSRSVRPVSDVLAADVSRGDFHLLVVGSAGRSGVVTWALGSVARHLLQDSRRPLAVVHPR